MRSFLPAIGSAILLAALSLAGCVHVSSSDSAAEMHGMVYHVGSTMYALIPDDDRNTRYAPDSLPAAFQVDSLRVIFSGTPGTMAENARYWGVPFALKSIRRE